MAPLRVRWISPPLRVGMIWRSGPRRSGGFPGRRCSEAGRPGPAAGREKSGRPTGVPGRVISGRPPGVPGRVASGRPAGVPGRVISGRPPGVPGRVISGRPPGVPGACLGGRASRLGSGLGSGRGVWIWGRGRALGASCLGSGLGSVRGGWTWGRGMALGASCLGSGLGSGRGWGRGAAWGASRLGSGLGSGRAGSDFLFLSLSFSLSLSLSCCPWRAHILVARRAMTTLAPIPRRFERKFGRRARVAIGILSLLWGNTNQASAHQAWDALQNIPLPLSDTCESIGSGPGCFGLPGGCGRTKFKSLSPLVDGSTV